MPHPRRFRFGVQCLRASSGDELRATARRAEDLGFSTLFVPDHFVGHPLAPVPAIMAAADATTTLRVGTLVLGNDYRHPVVVATKMATVDLLSGGRLELGIGAGWMTDDYEKAGLPLDRPGVRVKRLAESVAVLKGLMADGPFSYAGAHYVVTDLDGQPKPAQRPHPPLIIGGGGRLVLSLAAREADIVGINANLRTGKADDPATAPSLAPAATDEKVGWVREAAAARFDDLEVQSLVGFVHFTDDARSVADMMAPAFDCTPDEVLDAPVALVGSTEEMVEALERRRERWHLSYHVVPADQMDAIAPIVARLAGT